MVYLLLSFYFLDQMRSHNYKQGDHSQSRLPCLRLQFQWQQQQLLLGQQPLFLYREPKLLSPHRSVTHLYCQHQSMCYEAHILLGLGMYRCWICIVSDTDINDYIELCYFFKLLLVLTCACLRLCSIGSHKITICTSKLSNIPLIEERHIRLKASQVYHTSTHGYIISLSFLKLLTMSACQCQCCDRYSCLSMLYSKTTLLFQTRT